MAKRTLLLPDMWVTHYVPSRRTGLPLKAYYFNVRTRQKFYSKAAFYRYFRSMAAQGEASLNREMTEEEKEQMCSRCQEIGHTCITCPYPVIHNINPFDELNPKNPLGGRRIYRCSRCHWVGHNSRTCLRPA